MSTFLQSLKPARVWFYFGEICKYPHPSKKEEKIAAFLKKFGADMQLETLTDEAGNILIRKKASKGMEGAPTVILQSHMDMVCEKNTDKVHDFDKDPIVPVLDGDWVKADGTTLGADDGIGMAVQLAILEAKDIEHGPIECLFTVDEETGLTGAFALKPNFLKGSMLINLDSEDEGQIFIGCAGGKDTLVKFSYKTEAVPSGHVAIKIAVGGLKGGHSGDDINKGRGNSNKILNRIHYLGHQNYKLRLSFIDGGNLRNAIPREAQSVVVVPSNLEQEFLTKANKLAKDIKAELKTNEPDLFIHFEKTELPQQVIDWDTQDRLFKSLYAAPHGVIAMSPDIPGLTETSTNLASVKMLKDYIEVNTSQRSSIESAKEDVVTMVASTFQLAGAETSHGDGYPGWKPNLDSKLLKIARESYKRLFNKEPEVLAIHAGLECGLIGEKYPGMDMISIGPTLRGVHSPDERIHIGSVEKFWIFLLDLLKHIK